MSKFTKGKWTTKAYTVLSEQNVAIARISNVGWSTDTVQANTRLIEAAPEMYKTLLELRDFVEYENRQDNINYDCTDIDYLLARIDGEQEEQK